MIFACEKFRPYILGSHVIIHIDDAAIKYLMAKKDAKPRLIMSRSDLIGRSGPDPGCSDTTNFDTPNPAHGVKRGCHFSIFFYFLLYKLITFKLVHSYNVKHLTCTIF